MGKSSPIQESTSREIRGTTHHNRQEGSHDNASNSQQPVLPDDRSGHPDKRPFIETAAPVSKQTGDREKRAAKHPKKKRKTNLNPPAITDWAKKIIGQGATDNPDGENTVLISTWRSAATCVRIFRQRHLLDDPKARAEHRSGKSGGDVSAGRASSGPTALWRKTKRT